MRSHDLSKLPLRLSTTDNGVQTFVTLLSSPPAVEAVGVAKKLRTYKFLFQPLTSADALAIIKTYSWISAPTRLRDGARPRLPRPQ